MSFNFSLTEIVFETFNPMGKIQIFNTNQSEILSETLFFSRTTVNADGETVKTCSTCATGYYTFPYISHNACFMYATKITLLYTSATFLH